MKVLNYIGNITQRAFNGFEECHTFDEVLNFLQDPDNYMTIKKGIRRDLMECLDFQGDDADVIVDFKTIVRNYGFMNSELRDFDAIANDWFYNNKLPTRSWAVKLCFAFGLDNEKAGHFMWKVCKLNGFCYRSAVDIIYCYCLANGKSYDTAKKLIAEYKANPNFAEATEYKKIVLERVKGKSGNYTERTLTLRKEFANLKGMNSETFKKALFKRSRYLIDFNISAYTGITEQYQNVIEQLKRTAPADVGLGAITINRLNRHGKYKMIKLSESGIVTAIDGDDEYTVVLDGYNDKIEFSYEVVWRTLSKRSRLIAETEDHDTRPIHAVNAVCDHVLDLIEALPSLSGFRGLMEISRPERATEKEYGSARKVFVFLYFVQFVLCWEHYLYNNANPKSSDKSPNNFFSEFHEGLNDELEACGYGYLYYANPFDWHIMNCVRLLDTEIEHTEAIATFNEALAQLDENVGEEWL
jgi:hypothetical protein